MYFFVSDDHIDPPLLESHRKRFIFSRKPISDLHHLTILLGLYILYVCLRGKWKETLRVQLFLILPICTNKQRDGGNKNWKYPWNYKRFFFVKYKKSALSLESNGYLKFSNGGKEKTLYVKKTKHIDFGSIKNGEIVGTEMNIGCTWVWKIGKKRKSNRL